MGDGSSKPEFCAGPRFATTPMCVLVLFLLPIAAAQGAKTLDMYFIDVEGGQSTLLVSPGGRSLLIDAGYAG